jgi:hypothetical protein
MPLIKVPTVALYTGTRSFVFIDPATVNNVRPEPFQLNGETIDTICFSSGRLSFNTPWDLKTFFTALGRDHSDSVYEASKPLVAHA